MINESKLNVRMLHLMESGFFGKQLLSEGGLNISKDMKVRIFQSFYNYYNQSKWILVDGIPGTNTVNAMKYYFPEYYQTFYDLYDKALEYIKNNNLSELKKLNNIHNLRVLQSILYLAGYTEVKPDGVLGPITKDAMKEKLGSDDITQVTEEALKKVIDEAIANMGRTDMSFEADGFKLDDSAEEDAKSKEEPVATNPDGQSQSDKDALKKINLSRPVKITLNSGQTWFIAKAWIHGDSKKISSMGWETLDPKTRNNKSNNDWNVYFPDSSYASNLYIYAVGANGDVLVKKDFELCYNPSKHFAFLDALQEGCTKRVMFARIENPSAGFKIDDSRVPPKEKEKPDAFFQNMFGKTSDEYEKKNFDN